MSNVETYFAYLRGEAVELPEPRPIHDELYLAAMCGMDVKLPEPRPIFIEMALYALAKNGMNSGGSGEGGVVLPDLVNAALAAQILNGYEAIDQNGRKITGTMPDNGAVSERLTRTGPSYTIPQGHHSGEGKVYIDLEEKTVTPTSEAQEVTPSNGKLLSKVIVEAAEGGGGADLVITDADYFFYENYRADHFEDYAKLISPDASMKHMLHQAYAKRETMIDLGLLDTTKTEDFTSFFEDCYCARFLQLNTLRVGAAKNMTRMFHEWGRNHSNYESVISPDLSAWDVSNVENMSYMFANCNELVSPNFDGWDTHSLIDATNMFGHTSEGGANYNNKCTVLDLSSFDTSALEKAGSMFSNLSTVEQIVFGDKFTTAALKSANGMFQNCQKLKELDVSDWDTSNIEYASDMFNGCRNLAVLDVSKWNTSQMVSGTSIFQNCECLQRVDLSGWDTAKMADMYCIFNGCKSLSEIVGFSATNKVGVRVTFPVGTAAVPVALRRLTFRTDVENAIRSSISIPHAQFDRLGLVEMFNSLTDVSAMGLASSNKKITITGNPAVMDTFSLSQVSNALHKDYEALCSQMNIRYRGFDYQNAPVKYYLYGTSSSAAVTGVFSDLTEDMFEGNGVYVTILADTITVPDEMKLTDEDRLIATSRGWQLVE